MREIHGQQDLKFRSQEEMTFGQFFTWSQLFSKIYFSILDAK